MMKMKMQRKAAPLMMNPVSGRWSLQHVQLTWHGDHGSLHCAET